MIGPQAGGPTSGRAARVDALATAVYTAEDEALPDGGRRFRRFAELRRFVEDALGEPFWERTFPDAPASAEVLRRSRSATFSAAHVSEDGWDAVIWIRDGSWNAVTVVHELAHVATGSCRAPGVWHTGSGHGDDFVDALCLLWRRHLGLHAYGALRFALGTRGVGTHDHHVERSVLSE